MSTPRCLAIVPFFNDEDIVADQIAHLVANNHDLVVWDHGSTDGTAAAIDAHRSLIREAFYLPQSFDFYRLFEHISRYVIDNLAPQYDWISFVESDEFLEGPDRQRSYYEHICEVVDSPYSHVRFENFVYWFTDADDPNEPSPRRRIRHYSVWKDCGPRIYAWRASAMNVRAFNHNAVEGRQYPTRFRTCHYQFRSEQQLRKRIEGRRGKSLNGMNYHFDTMQADQERLRISASALHRDDGGELSMEQTINWRSIYAGL